MGSIEPTAKTFWKLRDVFLHVEKIGRDLFLGGGRKKKAALDVSAASGTLDYSDTSIPSLSALSFARSSVISIDEELES